MKILIYVVAILGTVQGVHKITVEQMAQLHVQRIDTNHDGIMSEAEFDADLVNSHDHNGDGCVMKHEFIHQYMVEYHDHHDTALAFYDYLDVNKDGCLSVQDLQSEFILMDADGDGLVYFGEFISWFMKAHPASNHGHGRRR